jgi:hypothetical protein
MLGAADLPLAHAGEFHWYLVPLYLLPLVILFYVPVKQAVANRRKARDRPGQRNAVEPVEDSE